MGLKLKVFLFIFVLPILLFGQANTNCQCALLDKVNVELTQKIEASDFKSATVFLSKYKTVGTNACKAKYYLSKLKIDFASQNSTNFEADLKLANRYIATINCNDLELGLLKLTANFYNASANYVKLLENETKLLNLAGKQNDKLGVATSLTNIASTFNRLNNAKKGILYAKKAVAISHQLPDSLSKAIVLNKIAAAYLWYGQDFTSKIHLDSAKYFAKNAYQIAKKFNAKTPQIGALLRLNAIAQEQKQYLLAIKYLQDATLLCKDDEDITKMASIYGDKANVYKLLKNYELAKVFADSSLHLNKKINYPPLIANAYQLIYDIEQLSGNYKNALEAYKNEKAITDSLTSSEKNAQVAEIEQKYNKVQNEKTISALSQEKQIKSLQVRLLGTLATVIILVSLLGYFIFRQRMLKILKLRNEELKIALSRQVELQNDLSEVRKNIAADFHDDLGNKLARISLLTNMANTEISIENKELKSKMEQIESDARYLYKGTKDFIFSLRDESNYLEELVTYLTDFGQDFFLHSDKKFITNKTMDKNIKLPYYWNKQIIFIFKEAFTNVLKHSNGDKVTFTFNYKNEMLVITCLDNGTNFPKENSQKSGLLNMKKRAEIIKAQIDIQFSSENGAQVFFKGKPTY